MWRRISVRTAGDRRELTSAARPGRRAATRSGCAGRSGERPEPEP
jgi:hypothetical protein